jgi:uncharacterized protein (DUF362 family)
MNGMNEKAYRVRAVHCDHRSTDEEVYAALKRATDPLDRSWERLRKAKRIGIKFNQDWLLDKIVHHEGHRQQLVSDPVVRATLRLLREHTKADIFVVDVGVNGLRDMPPVEKVTPILPILREFDVPFVDGRTAPVQWTDVPGGGLMFDQYPLPKEAVEADEFISVQKLKNHAFMGITLCMKNLFGLMGLPPQGRSRAYYHHLVRMPYMLADLGRIFKPALNIIDGMVCQAGEEWGEGEHPRTPNMLMAGDHVVTTDAVGAYLMGHDPESDWLTEPFHRDRNSLLCAAEGGFGSVKLSEIDWASEVQRPVGQFFSKITDPLETVVSWRRTTAEQGLYYRDNRKELTAKYAGEYILLQMGEVKWHDKAGQFWGSRRDLSGGHPEQAMWFKYVDPEETEGEHYEVYERTLQHMPEFVK